VLGILLSQFLIWSVACGEVLDGVQGRYFLPLLPLALIPLIVTTVAIAAFFREVLRLDRRSAARRTALHQAITWTAFVGLFGASVALPARVVQFARLFGL
jgi:hypothetical protein